MHASAKNDAFEISEILWSHILSADGSSRTPQPPSPDFQLYQSRGCFHASTEH
jgi:hypothetical protein